MNKKTLVSKLACTVLFLSPLALSCCATFVDTPRVDRPEPYARSGAYPHAVVKGQYSTNATTVTKTTKTIKSTHHKAAVPVNAPAVRQTETVTTTPGSAKVIKSTTTTTNTNVVAPTVAPATGMVVPTVGQ